MGSRQRSARLDRLRPALERRKRRYWIGNSIYSSIDGSSWEQVVFDEGTTTSLLGGRMADAASSGRLISSDRGDVTPNADPTTMEVEVVGIDGSVRVSKLSSGLDANV